MTIAILYMILLLRLTPYVRPEDDQLHLFAQYVQHTPLFLLPVLH